MDPLVIATWALAAATAVLAIVAFLQWRQMIRSSGEESRQTQTFKDQARLLEDGLSVSRGLLAQARAEREQASPFSITCHLHRDSTAGRAIFEFRVSGADPVVLKLRQVDVFESPGGVNLLHEDLAEGTLGVSGAEQ